MVISAIDESQRNAAKLAGVAYPISFAAVLAANFGIFARILVAGNPAV
jgi:hypothetical protein